MYFQVKLVWKAQSLTEGCNSFKLFQTCTYWVRLKERSQEVDGNASKEPKIFTNWQKYGEVLEVVSDIGDGQWSASWSASFIVRMHPGASKQLLIKIGSLEDAWGNEPHHPPTHLDEPACLRFEVEKGLRVVYTHPSISYSRAHWGGSYPSEAKIFILWELCVQISVADTVQGCTTGMILQSNLGLEQYY